MTTDKMISAASWVIEAPSLWTSRLPAGMKGRAPVLTTTATGLAWKVGDAVGGTPAFVQSIAGEGGSLTVDEVEWLASADGRKWLQRRDEVDGEVLYSTSDVWRLINATEDADFIRACYQAYNDWLADLCSQAPEQFIGIAKIPTTGIDDAVAELKRAHGELGLNGVMLDGWPCGKSAEGAPPKASASFWDAAASMGVPISLYRSLSSDEDEPTGVLTAGYAPEFWTDMTALIYANVCDDYPAIRFVVANPSPGWAPSTFEGLNESYMRTAGARQVHLGNPDLLPSDYLRRYFWYAVQQDRFSVLNRNYFGKSHLMWASFAASADAVWPNNRQAFARITAGLPDDDQQILAIDVVSRLYRLGNANGFSEQEVKAFERYELL